MTLVLLRHGESQSNLEKTFAGHTDVDLTPQGEEQARAAGLVLGHISFDTVFTSTLKRAYRTAEILLQSASHPPVDITRHDDLRERNYGDLTGFNKDDMCAKYGVEQVRRWRLAFDEAPPNGESLKDVLARVEPYYIRVISPLLAEGKTVLVCAHAHSLRAMLIVLGEHTRETIMDVEFENGVPVFFEYVNGRMERKVHDQG